MLKTIWVWIVRSSADPEKLSLTVKGLGALVPSLIAIAALVHVNVNPESVLALLDILAQWVALAATVISGIVTLYAATRKVARTVLGSNRAMNTM